MTMNSQSLITIAAVSIRIQTPSTATCAVIGTICVVAILVTVTIINSALINICVHNIVYTYQMCILCFVYVSSTYQDKHDSHFPAGIQHYSYSHMSQQCCYSFAHILHYQ